MKQYLEIGEYGCFALHYVRCTEVVHDVEHKCDICAMRPYLPTCKMLIKCNKKNRPDGKDVYFRLLGFYRKPKNHEK